MTRRRRLPRKRSERAFGLRREAESAATRAKKLGAPRDRFGTDADAE
jgi:hypothetical protein